jgi:hypothetical protein
VIFVYLGGGYKGNRAILRGITRGRRRKNPGGERSWGRPDDRLGWNASPGPPMHLLWFAAGELNISLDRGKLRSTSRPS